MRRDTSPHCPPVMCCSIRSASDPSVRPRQSMKPISHDGRNCAGLQDAPTAPIAEPGDADHQAALLQAIEFRGSTVGGAVCLH